MEILGQRTPPQIGTNARGPEDGKLRKATEDFEGLLISQMLQSIRESSLGGWQENHDQAGAVALEMAETQLAQVMASQGGLGIARSLRKSMAERLPPASQADPQARVRVDSPSRPRNAPNGSGS